MKPIRGSIARVFPASSFKEIPEEVRGVTGWFEGYFWPSDMPLFGAPKGSFYGTFYYVSPDGTRWNSMTFHSIEIIKEL